MYFHVAEQKLRVQMPRKRGPPHTRGKTRRYHFVQYSELDGNKHEAYHYEVKYNHLLLYVSTDQCPQFSDR